MHSINLLVSQRYLKISDICMNTSSISSSCSNRLLKHLIGFSKQWFVNSNLISIHLSELATFFLHLLHQEVGVILVYLVNSVSQTFFFFFVVGFVKVPHFCLLVDVLFITLFSVTLLFDLCGQELSHSQLFIL